ncbi:hypothetical protein [Streptomyces sp.]|uniref:hypothetical protein n=1 Tax=Streptomyces sp. TaxID=1931 RepID=UPI002F3FF6CC
MSAQPEHPQDPRVVAIPHTINAIGEALSGEDRARFYAEVLSAEEGEPISTVMRRWWMLAMLNRVPGAERSRANAASGRRLVAIEDLAGRLGIEIEGIAG